MTDSLADLVIEDVAKIFEEWHRRWVDDPDGYMSDMQAMGTPSSSYGELAAKYFVKLWDELAEIVP